MQIKYYMAKGENPSLLKDEEILKMSWQEFYGVLPGHQSLLVRSHNFNMFHTCIFPNEKMWTGYTVKYLLDVEEVNGKGNSKKGDISYQKEVEVFYDEDYIGYYIQNLVGDLGILPEVPLEKLEEYNSDDVLEDVDKRFATKLIKQRWQRLQMITCKAAVTRQKFSTLSIDGKEVETFIKAFNFPDDKAEKIRSLAKSDPKGFVAMRDELNKSMAEMMSKMANLI